MTSSSLGERVFEPKAGAGTTGAKGATIEPEPPVAGRLPAAADAPLSLERPAL